MKRHTHGRRAGLALLLATLAVLMLPAGASAFQKAIWGPVTYNGLNQFPMYQQLGVTIYEMDLDWNVVAPTRPKNPTDPTDPAYQWPPEVAQAVALAHQYHMQVLLQIIGAPSWANGGHTQFWAPRNPLDYARFATAAAREYASVKYWMVWGEPTRAGVFLPEKSATPETTLRGAQLAAPHLYARMLDAAYGALKAVRTSNVVIGGNTYTTGQLDPLQWIQNLKLPDGKPPRMDMYGHNPFTYETPSFTNPTSAFDEVQFSDLHELAGWIDKYLHPGLPMFLSEFTIPTQADEEFNFYVQPDIAATWVSDVLSLSRSYSRIFALGWIHVYDSPPFSYGGLLTVDGAPKPDFYAFEHG